MTCKGRIRNIVEVHRSDGVLCLEWRIPHFLDLSARRHHDYYDSPRFSFCGMRWCMRVHPNWTMASGRWVSLTLDREDLGPYKTVNIAVGIKGSGGVVQMMRVREREYCNNDYSSINEFCSRSKLSEQRQNLMPGDILTITCEMKIPGSAGEQPVHKDEVTVFTEGSQSSEKERKQSSDECIICCEKPVDCAFYRCGHTCMCYICAFQLWKSNSSAQCPICRNSIQDVLKLYK